MWSSEKRVLTPDEAAKLTLAKQLKEKAKDEKKLTTAKITARKVARNIIKDAAKKGQTYTSMEVASAYCGSYDVRRKVVTYIKDYLSKLGYAIDDPDKISRVYSCQDLTISWEDRVKEIQDQI